MAKTFSLSANIENGFAEGMQYLVTPNAQNAIHNIVNDFRSGIHSFTIIGSYGTGKSSFLLALESDLQKTGKQKYLLEAKNLSDAKSFEIMNIVGDYAEMSTLLSKALNVEGNTTSILDSLKNYYTQCQKKGKFLLIVVDEFGKVLEHAAKNNPEKELYFLQKLSELVNVPARKMMLLTTLHQNFGAYAKGLTEAQANEWTKVKGRFKEITFVEPVEQLLYLASAQLREERTVSDAENAKSLFELAKETRYVSKDFPLETAIQLYPLDLFSAYTITTAIQRYGQNERSLFSYLASQEPHGFQEHCRRDAAVDNGFVRLHDIADYLLTNMTATLVQRPVARILLETLEHGGNELTPLQSQALRTVGILNVLGAGAPLKATESILAASLAQSRDVPETLQGLRRRELLTFRQLDQSFRLWEGGGIDIEALLQKARKQLRTRNTEAVHRPRQNKSVHSPMVSNLWSRAL